MNSAIHSLLETAPEPVAASPLAQPKPRNLAPAKPELTRQERVASAAYLAMIALIVAFLAVAGALASLGV